MLLHRFRALLRLMPKSAEQTELDSAIADLTESASQYTALALAFSAGTFICIAASDLLPELQFHSHDRFGITCAFILGLVIAWGSGLFEPDHHHDHDRDRGEPQTAHDHDH